MQEKMQETVDKEPTLTEQKARAAAFEHELKAIAVCAEQLRGLDPYAQTRVAEYLGSVARNAYEREQRMEYSKQRAMLERAGTTTLVGPAY